MSLWDLISGGLQAGGNAYLANQDIGRIEDLGQNYYDQAVNFGQQAVENTRFQPFTVTSSLGSGSYNPDSGLSISASPQLGQAIGDTLGLAGGLANRFTDANFINNRATTFGQTFGVNQNQPTADSRFSSLSSMLGLGGTRDGAQYGSLLSALGLNNQVGGASGYGPMTFNDRVGGVDGSFANMMSGLNTGRVGSSGADPMSVLALMGEQGGRNEADIFRMLEDMQNPERERARLDLENRMFSQGRTGVRTDAYGGTPEQLALEKAIEESRSGNAFNAYRLAADEAYKNRSLRANEVSSAFGLGLQERGQDITQNDILGRLGLGAINAALTQRGQDIDQNQILGQLNLAGLDRALTERGQDITQNQILGQLGLGAVDRSLTERGQNINEDLARSGLSLDAFNAALAERGQNIQQQDIFANQGLNLYRNALAEQGLLGDQMAQLAQTAFLPQQMLLQELGLGLDAAEIANRNLLAGQELNYNSMLGGLDALLGFQTAATTARSNRDRDILNLILGSQESGSNGLADLFANAISDLFN